ncbi:MAG: cation-translocating P-type ATPase [Candidatus Tectimicrobiota bacterium]
MGSHPGHNHRTARPSSLREAEPQASWHAWPVADLAQQLQTDVQQGLRAAEAARRLLQAGPNALRHAPPVSALALLAGQFRSLVIWVLMVAALVSAALGEFVDGLAILAIVLLNAVLGFFQEYRAEQSVATLARLTAPRARVLRDGHALVLAATEIVRGDILLLDAGDLVAADARLIEAAALRTTEAPLTGESQPVEKHADLCRAETPLAERQNMVFLGTSVAAGSGRALVVATGMDTEVGHIATLLATASSGATPLQQRLDQVARRLLWACLGIVVLMFALGLFRALPPFELFLSAISLAVAAIPEGLPAVVTMALALGVQRMVRRHALVRRLPAVETLGCAQVICSDKTGTLTVGTMTARQVVTSASSCSVSGEGYATSGEFVTAGAGRSLAEDGLLDDLLRAAAACNDAELHGQGPETTAVGDPTEIALLVLAAKRGIQRDRLETEMPRLGLLPFDSDRKRMTVIRQRAGQPWAFVKGAPEVLLERCATIRTTQGVALLTESERQRLRQTGAGLAQAALRVLALAERPLETPASAEASEHDLIFLGFIGLQDPPRPEAREAVQRCRRAGIRTVMITGDHPDTARAIARELGMLQPEDEVMVGQALDDVSDAELTQRVTSIAVYARVTAEHKLRIVRAWKRRGAIVAMTGDGVNDAPALKEASIGVAMGRTGTEVTKEAAAIIITDDNFASIVAAVEEGRGIYDNIAKTLAYLLGGNVSELAVMLMAALIGWPLPLLPVQLLWINLVTDGLPALALATDPIDPAVLRRPPRHPEAQLLDWALGQRVALVGCLTAGVALSAFAYAWYSDDSLAQARDAAFSTLVLAELLRAFGARSDTRTVWQIGLFSNRPLVMIVLASFGLHLAIHTLTPLQALFGTTPASLSQWLIWLGLGALPLLVLELRKSLQRVHRRRLDGACGEAR